MAWHRPWSGPALLLYKITGSHLYLSTAESQYAPVRRCFLAPPGLYTLTCSTADPHAGCCQDVISPR
jgi:hypothetical protein